MSQAAIDAIKAHLESQSTPWPDGIDVYDGEPTTDMTKPYICIYDQTGRSLQVKYAARPGSIYFPFQLTCVARTREGLRDLMVIARSVMLWAPVSGASLIVEDGSAPIMSDGEGSEKRLVGPLTAHCFLPA